MKQAELSVGRHSFSLGKGPMMYLYTYYVYYTLKYIATSSSQSQPWHLKQRREVGGSCRAGESDPDQPGSMRKCSKQRRSMAKVAEDQKKPNILKPICFLFRTASYSKQIVKGIQENS